MSGNPYPDRDFIGDEQWAEREAAFCDQMASELRRFACGWSAKHTGTEYGSHPSNLQMAYECSIRADVWAQMAGNLRRPRVSRLESDPTTALGVGGE